MNIPQQVTDSLKTLEQFILSLETTTTPPPSVDPAPYPVIPGHTVIENAPYSVTTRATIWGLNWDGSNDTGDLDSSYPDGNSRGFFTDPSTGKPYETHNQQLIGASLPREVLLSTFLGVDSWQTDGITAIWGHYSSDLRAWSLQHKPTLTIDSAAKYTLSGVVIADAGPTASTHNGLDLTYASGHALNTFGAALCTYRIEVAGKVLTIRGWDFVNRRVIGS